MENSKKVILDELVKKIQRKINNFIPKYDQKIYLKEKNVNNLLEIIKNKKGDNCFEESKKTFYEYNDKYISSSYDLNQQILIYEAQKKLLSNKKQFEIYYGSYIENCKTRNRSEEKKSSLFDTNLERSYNLIFEELENYYSKYLDNTKNTAKTMKNVLKKYKDGNQQIKSRLREEYPILKSSENRKKIELLSAEKDSDNLFNILKGYNQIAEHNMKEILIRNMETIGGFFNEYNLLERYCKSQKRTDNKFYKIDFNYPIETEIKNIFSQDFLKKKKLNTLLPLVTFWNNKFTKELARVNEAFFIIQQLKLQDKYKKEKTDISYNDLEKIGNKAKLLERIYIEIENSIRNNPEIGDRQVFNERIQINLENDIQYIFENIYEDYNEKLKSINIIENKENSDFVDSIEEYKVAINNYKNAYITKDIMLRYLISDLSTNTNINWGTIEDKNINLRDDFILLMVDFKKFNNPFTVHIPKSKFEECLKRLNMNEAPKYEKICEFRYPDGEIVTTNIYMPMSIENKLILKQKKTSGEYNENLMYLDYLVNNGKLPMSLDTKAHKAK